MRISKQARVVFLIEVAIVVTVVAISYLFWSNACPGDSWRSCLGETQAAPVWFFIYGIIRPLLATPVFVIALIGGESFGTFWGTIFSALCVTLSSLLIFLPAKYFGKIYVKPFLAANLPAMWRLARTQDYKIVFFTRLVPFPFDIMSILFGALDFHFKRTVFATFLGVLPQCYLFARIAENPSEGLFAKTLSSLIMFAVIVTGPLLIYELLERKKGTSLWNRIKSVYKEFLFELRANNEIVRRQQFSGEKVPVILLYGFFSSRRSLIVLERLLQSRGIEVMSFNLGGLFGVFFTRGIRETARFVDIKIKRQLKRHKLERVNIVAHSKGGLVAVWWILNLGGSKYCDTVITLGTPFSGSYFTYLALITPLGFIWKDVWQMRPGSELLSDLHNHVIPSNVKIYCMYSNKDKVSRGDHALMTSPYNRGQIQGIPMHHLTHFEFLYRRDVGDTIAHILKMREEQRARTTSQAI